MENLKWGSTGKVVERLQAQLNKTGIAGPKRKVDGILEPKTRAALDKYDPQEGGRSHGVEEKIDIATAKNLADYTKHLGQMKKYLDVIQKQKKKIGASARKDIDKMSRKVREPEHMSELAAGACDGAWSCAAGGASSQNFQIDAHNLKIDVDDMKAVKGEDQKDFDRRITGAQKRIAIAEKAIRTIEKDLAKLRKKAGG